MKPFVHKLSCICREVPNKSLVTFVWCLLSIVKITSEDRLSVLSCVNSWCWCLLSEASYFFSFLRLNALAITLFLNSNSTHFSPAVMMAVVSQFNVPSQLLESFWRLQVRMYFQESTRMLHEKKKKKHTSVKAFFQCISLLSWIISNTEMSNWDEKPKNTKNGAERFSKGRLEMSGVHLRTLRTCSYDPKLFWPSVVWQMPFCRTVHKMLGNCFLGSISK